MTTGKIVHWNFEKMFGFIKCDEDDEEIFFHLNECNISYQKVNVGDRVSFVVVKSKNRPGKLICVNVSKIS